MKGEARWERELESGKMDRPRTSQRKNLITGGDGDRGRACGLTALHNEAGAVYKKGRVGVTRETSHEGKNGLIESGNA